MNALDRRRVVVASVFTLVALPALWVLNRDSAATSGAPNAAAAGVDVEWRRRTHRRTTAYQPEPPLFVGGDDAPTPPGLINVAVPPAPGANERVDERQLPPLHRLGRPASAPRCWHPTARRSPW